MNANHNSNQDDTLHDLLLGMGKVQGILEAIQRRQQDQTRWMAKLDDRLRIVERKAAIQGMVGGAVVALILGALSHIFKGALPGG